MIEQIFNRIRKNCKDFNSNYFGDEGKFNKTDFEYLEVFYSPSSCFTFSPKSGEIGNVISCKKGEAYSILKENLDKIKTDKEIFALIHKENKRSIELFKRLGFIETKEQKGKFVKYIRKKQTAKLKAGRY